jgi:hypothetical protein
MTKAPKTGYAQLAGPDIPYHRDARQIVRHWPRQSASNLALCFGMLGKEGKLTRTFSIRLQPPAKPK